MSLHNTGLSDNLAVPDAVAVLNNSSSEKVLFSLICTCQVVTKNRNNDNIQKMFVVVVVIIGPSSKYATAVAFTLPSSQQSLTDVTS